MKSINEAIIVDAHNGVPRRFRWDGRTYRTRKLLDYWILQTRWWGREERRIYFRLETDRGVMEVYRASNPSSSTRSVRDRFGFPGEDVVRRAAEPNDRSDHHVEQIRHAASPFIEGDTHTRELRRTDFPYRPDARRRHRAGCGEHERAEGRRGRTTARKGRLRWTLSKVLD